MHLAVSTGPGPAVETRLWRLRGYAGKQEVHTSVCHGDRALDEAMARLEQDSAVTRIVVGPA